MSLKLQALGGAWFMQYEDAARLQNIILPRIEAGNALIPSYSWTDDSTREKQ